MGGFIIVCMGVGVGYKYLFFIKVEWLLVEQYVRAKSQGFFE